MKPFSKVLIANRGEIACRIIRTLSQMGLSSVAVYSSADAHARHVAEADEAVLIGPAPAKESYLHGERILEAARATGAGAIHPGYGFLSENAAFAEACERVGIVFIGPTPQQMRDFGLKHTARALAKQAGVPLLPGTGLLASALEGVTEAAQIGYPVMLKSTAGGGGIGMQICHNATELEQGFAKVQRLSQSNFQDSGVYLEKYVRSARHLEVQIFGDGRGQVIALGERDCSSQRRNQKVIEETPACGLLEAHRQRLATSAVALGKAVSYRSAGTVEFVYDVDRREFYFLEVNTRLQVEHGVTELVTGVDLVEWMVQTAAGQPPDLSVVPASRGHSIQVRIYAEDPGKNFQPSSGLLTQVGFPAGIRCDAWIEAGTEVSPFYDPLLAKIMVHGSDRADALRRMGEALEGTSIAGLETNLDYLQAVVRDPVFVEGLMTTRYLSVFQPSRRTIDVLAGGTFSALQDYPGRVGYWAVGVPPSGPMDFLALRLGNRALGNPENAAGLELTVQGPTLHFHTAATICLTGAGMEASLDGLAVAFWEPVQVSEDSVLRLGAIPGAGLRSYLTVAGGFDVPDYLGSKSTFTLGQFGGHGGRTLRVGDVLKLARQPAERVTDRGTRIPEVLRPEYGSHWDVAVMYGPHGAPDFLTMEDMEVFLTTDWQIHYNSSRTGVRLVGPKPHWARRDGGEAGLHPSNIHDTPYAIGAIDFTGDMPVILGPDGPSLGGFVCPVTIIQAERWKIGQFKPGDTVRFYCLSFAEALEWEQRQDDEVRTLTPKQPRDHLFDPYPQGPPVIPRDARLSYEQREAPLPDVTYRPAGDKYLLIEYGPMVLDLHLRFRVHALMTWLEDHPLPGLLDLTPGIRSLQVYYDSRRLSQSRLLSALQKAEEALPAISEMEVPTRRIRLPLSWEDPAIILTIQKYEQSVRKDAPWCPSNIEFIRRINGLDSIADVQRIIFEARYLVMGLGDVYLGAPVATPLDPRHRLVTTKYNPARTWTPDNVVGIGGAYLCIYGMEGPGGYQLFGRTCQVWNRYKTTPDFQAGRPWLLRFFDQIQFYPVSGAELAQFREDFIQGKVQLEVQEDVFRLRDYQNFLTSIRPEAEAFKRVQQAAFEAERERWASQASVESEAAAVGAGAPPEAFPPDTQFINSGLAASVWKILVAPGALVEKDQPVIVLESMKMEISVVSPISGKVLSCRCAEGQMIQAGDLLLALAPLDS